MTQGPTTENSQTGTGHGVRPAIVVALADHVADAVGLLTSHETVQICFSKLISGIEMNDEDYGWRVNGELVV